MDRFAPPRMPSFTGIGNDTGYSMPTMASLLPPRYQGSGFSGFGAADKYLSDALGQFPAYDEVFGGGSVGAPFTNVGAIAGGALADAAQYINTSAARNGIPANLLAAIIARESTGNWARDGNRYVYLSDRGQSILPYSGMTDAAVRRVGMDPRSLIGNQSGQIEAAARLIRQIADNEAQGYGWQGVANVYYSGDPTGNYTPGDSYQYGTTKSYGNDILDFWERLEPGGPSSQGGSSATRPMVESRLGGDPLAAFGWGGSSGQKSFAGAGSSIGNLVSTFGGREMPVTQEFGLTDFARSQLNGMYSYSTAYGVQGHAGVDFGMVPGTPLFAPVSGTVVTAGGTGYYSDERYNKYTPGIGELKIKLDNGDELILGHMERITVQPGQRITAGTPVGYSGTYNGPHSHVEYRRYTPGATSSGYTAVDPRQALSGGAALTQSMTTLGGSPSSRLGVDLGSLFGW